jgi:hypothetical protein
MDFVFDKFCLKILGKNPGRHPCVHTHIRTQNKRVGQSQWEGELISMDI